MRPAHVHMFLDINWMDARGSQTSCRCGRNRPPRNILPFFSFPSRHEKGSSDSDDAFEVCRKSQKWFFPHWRMRARDESCDICLAFSRWIWTPSPSNIGKQQKEERCGRFICIILLHSLHGFNLSNGKNTVGTQFNNHTRFMLQSWLLRATPRGELNKQLLWLTRLVSHTLEFLENLKIELPGD